MGENTGIIPKPRNISVSASKVSKYHAFAYISYVHEEIRGKTSKSTKILLSRGDSIDRQVPQVAEQINIRKRRDERKIKGPRSAPLIPFNGNWQLTVPFFVLLCRRSQVRRFRISRTQNTTPNRDAQEAEWKPDEKAGTNNWRIYRAEK